MKKRNIVGTFIDSDPSESKAYYNYAGLLSKVQELDKSEVSTATSSSVTATHADGKKPKSSKKKEGELRRQRASRKRRAENKFK